LGGWRDSVEAGSNAGQVIEELEQYLDEYVRRGPGETSAVVALHEQLASDRAAVLERHNERGHVTTSLFALDRDRACALLVHHRLYDLWLPPGGHYEAPDTLWASACRELEEETGVVGAIPYLDARGLPLLLDIDTHPIPARPGRNEGAHRHHDLAFLARVSGCATLSPRKAEVHAARWIALDDLMCAHHHARVRRLARKAIAAARSGGEPGS
jgi:8-oxo-dGTP pyrophosphatase MutT (NUDIX family)